MAKHSFPFVGKRKIWYIISIILIIVGLVSIFTQGFNLGIDFTGGNMLHLAFEQPVSQAELRGVIEDYVTSSPSIQETENNEFLVRTVIMDEASNAELLKAVETKFGTVDILRNDAIGPVIGKELVSNAKWALVLSLILMLIYITVRFRFFYAVSALIPLMHDILITIGIVSLLRIELDVSFVAAILTILGYSINATIVIFDRVRENISYGIKGTFPEVVNLSINQTLGRSINTVVAVLLLVLSLFFFGGETTKSFVFILLTGIVFGGYSSVFIAGPILSDLVPRFGDSAKGIYNKKKAKKK